MVSDRFTLFLTLRVTMGILLGVVLWGLYRQRQERVCFKYWSFAWFSITLYQSVVLFEIQTHDLFGAADRFQPQAIGSPAALFIAALSWLFPAWMVLAAWSLHAGPLTWRQVGSVVAAGMACGAALHVSLAHPAASLVSGVTAVQVLRAFPSATVMVVFGVLYYFRADRTGSARSWGIPAVCGLTGLHYTGIGLTYFQLPPYRQADALLPSLAGLVLPAATAIALVYELLGDLTASNRKLQQLWERALDPMRLVDEQGVVLQVNASFCQLIGKPEHEILGRPFTDCYAEESRTRILSQFRERVATQTLPARFTRWMRLWNDKDRCLELVNTILPDEGRWQVLTAFRDVTSQREADEALRRSEERLQMALDASSDCLFDWRFTSPDALVTPRFYQMLGYHPYEFSPSVQWWNENSHPEDTRRVNTLFESGFDPQGRLSAEFRLRTKSGSYRWVELQGRIVEYGENGTPLRMLGTVSDVTARKQAEQDRLALEQQLHQSRKLEAIGRLAGGVAHDFNNLLTVITGYAQIALRSKQNPDPTRTALEQIELAAERAAGVTRQLLVFGRRQAADRQPVSLSAAVRESERMLRWMVGEDVKLTLDLEADLPLVPADRSQLQQVLLNLAGNARDAMPDGGELRIETRELQTPSGKWVRLSVRDNGVGMDEETKARIFEPFFTTKAQEKGTGLGLATVYGVIQQSGGRIEVQSQPGSGTSFTIDLPAVEENLAPDAGNIPSALGENETILVVEDEPGVRELTLECLRQLNYSVLAAQNGEEALALASSWPHPIALLLTDVRMPGMKGPELAKRMLEIRPGLKTMFMSGYPEPDGTDPQQAPFAHAYLQKPFTLNALAEAVKIALGAAARPRHVLVVDDEPGVRSLFRDVLAFAGYQVSEAASGREAMRSLQSSRVDLVITDLAMPDSDGMELLMQLRSLPQAIPVVAVSGAFDGRFLQVSQRLGAQRTLRKPLEPNELIAAVRELLPQS